MAKSNHFESFDPENGDWEIYLERFDLYCLAHKVKETEKVAALLSAVGGPAYKRIRALASPHLPISQTYDQIIALIKPTAKPKVTKMTARYKFYNRKQKPKESISDFDIALREAAEECKFTNLEETLCDFLVLGLKDQRIQTDLLNKDEDLTHESALRQCLTLEAVREGCNLLHEHENNPPHDKGDQSETNVNHVKAQRKKKVVKFDKCNHCGKSNHAENECYLKDAVCHLCKQKGHIKPVCKRKGKPVHNVEEVQLPDPQSSSDELDCHSLRVNTVDRSANGTKPMFVHVKVQTKNLKMELDTGAAVTVISKSVYGKLGIRRPLRQVNTVLTTHTNEQIKPLGVATVKVEYEGQKKILEMYVVEHEGPTLLGRSWLREIKLNWAQINVVNLHADEPVSELSADTSRKLQQILDKHEKLFRPGIGKLNGCKAKLYVKSDSQPKFFKSRTVEHSIKDKVNNDIERLVNAGIVSPVAHSEWATPIVPVCKEDGSVRICGDFKVTVNPVLNIERYPQPHKEELFAKLAGGVSFSKLDLTNAYLQMEVDDESKEYLTINTSKGLFRYNRLPFGISSAPAIFQRTMETVLQGIAEAPAPENVSQLRSFLGLVNYYASFMENLATVLAPLNELLCAEVPWQWSSQQEDAFKEVKELLTSAPVLTHYDPNVPITLACDTV